MDYDWVNEHDMFYLRNTPLSSSTLLHIVHVLCEISKFFLCRSKHHYLALTQERVHIVGVGDHPYSRSGAGWTICYVILHTSELLVD